MDLIESFKESGLDHERGEEYTKKFEENKYFDVYFLSDIWWKCYYRHLYEIIPK